MVSLQRVARLLLPPGEGREAVWEADDRWRVEAGGRRGSRVAVWGREPTRMQAGPGLLRYAVRRERLLRALRRRSPAGLSLTGVHRWYYEFFQARHLHGTMRALRSGAIVELTGPSPAARVLDLAAEAAGAPDRVGALHIGSGGQINAPVKLNDGRRVLLRVGAADSSVDPSRSLAALVRLAPSGLSCVPEPLDHGQEAPAGWTTESLLPGQPPETLNPRLVSDVAAFCLELPRNSEPPRAFESDMTELVGRLPQFSDRLLELKARSAPVIAVLPSVLRHGDLWHRNLLTQGGKLTGVVDWDSWHPSAVPGTDLLHLVAVARAFATRCSFTALLSQRPWEDRLFADAAARYWRELGVDPRREVLEAVGLAWWAGQTASDLLRNPHQAEDETWLADTFGGLRAPGDLSAPARA